ncbi:NAD-P-binding protein [Dentipellis sp. KUC8613]|nr:NAD-P-binding protein [Dentipellis sp. KUC8613]
MSSRVWLITGANSGLGLALAEYALSQGDHVIATARNVSKLPTSVKAADPLQLDMDWSQDEIKAAGLKALAIHGHIDILVNMAGYGLESPVEEMRAKDLERQFQTNLFAPIYLTQALLPSFRARKSGTILNVSSIASVYPGPGFSGYCSSKAALDSVSEALAEEVAPWNIRVLIVQPGFFPTNWFATAAAGGEEARAGTSESVYADLYGAGVKLPSFHLRKRWIGEVQKAAQRMYEAATGTGMAAGLDPKWNRVLLGVDCGEKFKGVVEKLQGNIDAMEPIWRSTDVDPKKMDEMRRAAGIVD